MTILAIAPTHDRPGKRDVSAVFWPEARRFAAERGAAVQFDDSRSMAARRREVEALIWETSPDLYDHVAIFCHGLKDRIQTGHTIRSVGSLAEVIARRSVPEVRVTLYACDAARDDDRAIADDKAAGPGGEGGFADRLRDALLAEGCCGGWVDAHVTTGHATRNPYVRRFRLEEEAAGFGGDWLIAPGSRQWRTWRRALWGKDTPADIRLRFPAMTTAELRDLFAPLAA